ncbi:fimbrial protein [Serratia ureilytica]|uniref:fimbrial protein n=1 Tax=Serratia ureilytica TaxID=300181 RepID=UPI0018D834DC|nr:fimbrial protein [Serratia ureilytica]MBH3008163.1 type 1 fimbrial protein [Serratia ureilytica]MBH3022823.1 type 1 fimbrial protein [Serratia ureilytica]MBH3108702.1 type 1 fimbrial protein [Serratia ureilytica]MBH3176096.1 type 1 fimbrial protein [Serratia ureilytica]QQU62269.1 type 1 fimbrial protein [Serratia ureilytica]
MYRRHELRYYGTLGGLAMMAPVSLAILMLLLPPSHAADNWEVEGANGVLYVTGALTESACRLEMASAYQDVWLGETGTARLETLGAQGGPVAVELRLKDCLRAPASQRDVRSGSLTWADNQPAVTVRFRAVSDMDNPQLVKAQGVSGMGLRLTDPAGRDVRLGSRGEPLFLTPGQSSLVYTVTPERTGAPLVAGVYHAAVDFQLSYD